MRYRLLQWVLDQEGTSFQRIDRRWRPTDLLYLQQARALLRDTRNRCDALSAAEEELRSLERSDVYIRALKQMRVYARVAAFTWESDQLTFVRAISGFYESYGAVLRLLKQDEARGRLAET